MLFPFDIVRDVSNCNNILDEQSCKIDIETTLKQKLKAGGKNERANNPNRTCFWAKAYYITKNFISVKIKAKQQTGRTEHIARDG